MYFLCKTSLFILLLYTYVFKYVLDCDDIFQILHRVEHVYGLSFAYSTSSCNELRILSV